MDDALNLAKAGLLDYHTALRQGTQGVIYSDSAGHMQRFSASIYALLSFKYDSFPLKNAIFNSSCCKFYLLALHTKFP